MESFVVPDSILGPRDTVVVDGPDAFKYLQSQVSQDLTDLDVGGMTWSLVLDPNGKVAGFARVTRPSAERFELDTDAGHGAELLARIDRFKIRVAATTSLIEAADPQATHDEAARIELGWPAMGREIVPGETIPAGTGLSRIAVSFTKGCYPGQELVERMDSRGADAPKTLRRLEVPDGSVAGDAVLEDDAAVGEITSVAGRRALGWVKRTSGLGDPVQF